MNQNNSDLLADAYLKILFRRNELTLVSIGACDGVTEDSFANHLMYSECVAKGHYFEPNKELSAICAKFTGAFAPAIMVHAVAVWNTDKPVEYWHLPLRDAYGQLSRNGTEVGYGAVGDLIPRELTRESFAEDVRKIKVPCMTWDTACRSYVIDKVDCLNIDIEGRDIDVLQQIDCRKHQMSWVKVELRHDPSPASAAFEIKTKYESDYRVLFGRFDLYLISKELPELKVLDENDC